MPHLTPDLERALVQLGFGDQLDELRRTGRAQLPTAPGSTPAFATIADFEELVRANEDQPAVTAGPTAPGAPVPTHAMPAETLEQLRRYHRFIPDRTLGEMETTLGEDIDGDGHVGPRGAGAPPSSAPHAHALRSTAGSAGPFVQAGHGSRTVPLLLLVLVLLALGVWFVLR